MSTTTAEVASYADRVETGSSAPREINTARVTEIGRGEKRSREIHATSEIVHQQTEQTTDRKMDDFLKGGMLIEDAIAELKKVEAMEGKPNRILLAQNETTPKENLRQVEADKKIEREPTSVERDAIESVSIFEDPSFIVLSGGVQALKFGVTQAGAPLLIKAINLSKNFVEAMVDEAVGFITIPLKSLPRLTEGICKFAKSHKETLLRLLKNETGGVTLINRDAIEFVEKNQEVVKSIREVMGNFKKSGMAQEVIEVRNNMPQIDFGVYKIIKEKHGVEAAEEFKKIGMEKVLKEFTRRQQISEILTIEKEFPNLKSLSGDALKDPKFRQKIYQVLDLPEGAPIESIKSKYRSISNQYINENLYPAGSSARQDAENAKTIFNWINNNIVKPYERNLSK